MKTYAPINLTLYQIITPNITKEQIEEAFKVLRTQMITNQELYYAHHYQNLCTQLLNTNILLKGSLNSLGRKLGITAPSPVPYQGYNFSEMFRVNVLTKMGLSLQNEAILNIFAQSETTTPQIILESYRKVYPNLPVPTYEFVKRTTQRYQTTGVIGNVPKSETLYTEYLRVRSKISRLKNERVLRVANQIMSIAQQYNASIILENLSWTPHSKWEHSIQQEAIQSKATRVGIRVKKVSPKNTSQSCPTCKNRITHSARATRCIQCQKTLNRDVLASRNIALKGIPVISSNSFIQSLHTRVTRPVTPGSIVSSVTRNTT